MDDNQVWSFEESLWTADYEHYRQSIDGECLMVVPEPPYIATGPEAVETVSHTPRWTTVEFTEQHVARPQDGLIVIAYRVRARRKDTAAYEAHCTSTYRRLGPDQWKVIQHQQTPPIMIQT